MVFPWKWFGKGGEVIIINNETAADIGMYSVDDIQKIMGCSRKKVYLIINSSTFPKIKIGRQFFVPKFEFQKWIQRNLYKNIIL